MNIAYINLAQDTYSIDLSPEGGGGSATLQEKTVDVELYTEGPGGTVQVVTPDSGYDGISKANLKVPSFSAEREESITENGTIEINPEYGYWGFKKLTLDVNVPSEMKPEVELSETITENGYKTFTPETGKVYKNAIINVNVPIPTPSLQSKEVEPTTSQQTVNPDSGYDGLSSVVVDAVTYEIDPNISANNIRNGVSILGVTGTMTPPKTEVLCTQAINENGNFTYNPPEGQVFNSAQILVAVPSKYEETLTVTPDIISQEITPEFDNYVWNKVNVRAVTSTIDGNIQPENILNDVTILGVTGTVLPRKNEQELTRTYTSNGSYTITPSGDNVYSKMNLTIDVEASRLQERTVEMSLTETSKEIAPTTGYDGMSKVTVTHPAVESNTTATITTNGEHVITPSTGYDGTLQVTATVNIPQKTEETCTQTITSNGTQTFNPTEGNVFDKAVITTDIHPTDTLTKSYTSNGTFTETGEYNGATITVNVQPDLQVGNVTPTKDHQTITPEEGYDGFSSIEVSAVDYTIDANIQAGNIKKDVGILGITGTLEEKKPEETLSKSYTANGTYTISPDTAGDVISSATVEVNVEPTLQTKSATPSSTEMQTILPDEGYDGLEKVFVDQVDHTIDSNIVAGNIKKDIAILGITGTLEEKKEEETKSESYTSNGTYSINPTSGKVLSSVEVVVNVPGTKPEETCTQTITENGTTYTYNPTEGSVFDKAVITVNIPEPEYQEKTVTPTTSQQEIICDEGYQAIKKVTIEAVTSSIDSNIVAGNIKNGVTILGVAGTYETPTETITITPTNEQQVITPSEGHVFSSVTVEGIDVDELYNEIHNL